MSNFKYKDGQYLGKENKMLLVHRTTRNPRTKHWSAIFVCPYCSKEFESSIPAVAAGKVVSCGCYRPSMKNLIGQTFGKLTVIKDSGKRGKDGRIIWLCQCSCKNKNLVEVNSKNLLFGDTVSCGCVRSKGESKLQALFQEFEIKYEKEKIFKDCIDPKTKGVLRFDFYLVDYKCLIEYDGNTHYKVTLGGWNTEENFRKIQYHDSLKDEFCQKNDIPLIRISYKDFDKINYTYLKRRLQEVNVEI